MRKGRAWWQIRERGRGSKAAVAETAAAEVAAVAMGAQRRRRKRRRARGSRRVAPWAGVWCEKGRFLSFWCSTLLFSTLSAVKRGQRALFSRPPTWGTWKRTLDMSRGVRCCAGVGDKLERESVLLAPTDCETSGCYGGGRSRYWRRGTVSARSTQWQNAAWRNLRFVLLKIPVLRSMCSSNH